MYVVYFHFPVLHFLACKPIPSNKAEEGKKAPLGAARKRMPKIVAKGIPAKKENRPTHEPEALMA